MKRQLRYNRPKLYPKQAAFVDCPARITVVEASTKAGKTIGCLIWLIEQAMRAKKPGDNYWWVAPTLGQSEGVMARMIRTLRNGGLKSRELDIAVSKRSVTLPNGAVVWFKSGDNPESLYGEDVHAAVMDEATRQREIAWHAVRTTLTATRGPVKIIGNVKGRKNWVWDMARKAQAGGPGATGYAYFKLTAYDAAAGGVIDLGEIEQAKRDLPEGVFRELYLAEADEEAANPFGLAAIAACVGAQSTLRPTCFGIDLAKSIDWTVLCGLDEHGVVCHLERWQGIDWDTTTAKILATINGWPTLVDSTGVGDPIVDRLSRVRPNVKGFKFSQSSKQQLMEGLRAAIHKREIVIPDGWLRQELEAFEYHYTLRGGVSYSAPSGMHDDGVCALALAVQNLTVTTRNEIGVRVIGGAPRGRIPGRFLHTGPPSTRRDDD